MRLVGDDVRVEGFTSRAVEATPAGPPLHARQLVMVVPTTRFDLEQGAEVGVARSVRWWDPGMPVYCKLVNRNKESEAINLGGLVARMVALNARDAARFESLFDDCPSVIDPPATSPQPRV